MAKLTMELPNDIIKDFEKINRDAPDIFDEMTQAGAKVVYKHILQNMRYAFKEPDKLSKYLKITKPYVSMGGKRRSTKVAFYGYYRKNDKDYIDKQHRNATESFTYKTGRGHGATRTGGQKEASYEYTREGVPVPLIVIAREFGSSSGEAKKPFIRKAFNKKAEIEQAMLDAQKKASGGLLE